MATLKEVEEILDNGQYVIGGFASKNKIIITRKNGELYRSTITADLDVCRETLGARKINE